MQLEDISRNVSCILRLEGNKYCVDCNAPFPDWVSLHFGILVCLTCAGKHRGLGVHVTLVRSLKLDTIAEEQLQYLLVGGNDNFKSYCESTGSTTSTLIDYQSPLILYYREILLSKIQGREPLDFSDFSSKIPLATNNTTDRPKSPLISQKGARAPSWVPDSDVQCCMLCDRNFGYLLRRHHCRRCGKCVCAICAPSENARPIHEWGYSEPVRHCKECYKSPIVNWEH